ncbi:MAG: acireductone synthase [Pirellulales bacterium]|nr:acireductone synthase [Pirellulales bacterium]
MPHFSATAVLLDVEGTTSSISFVTDVLFPYAAARVEGFLQATWDEPATRRALELIARDADKDSWEKWSADRDPQQALDLVLQEVRRLMAGDVKATGLKELQGLIWRGGFESGELQSHVYDDVPPWLAECQRRGVPVRIYSSGSIAAQQLFFAHTVRGNLLPYLSGHYDTTTGPKRDKASYAKIAADYDYPPDAILFASDIVAELDAARAAGMQTVLLVRPENAAAEGHPHPVAHDFARIILSG